MRKSPRPAGFPIVGIGASAGGLAAFEAFLSAVPAGAEGGLAFVLVQHLAPDHKSILVELVKRYTRMRVYEVEDGMRVRPGCAYIIPPNRDMALLDGALQLFEPAAPHGQRLPIDFFFRSLAQDRRERAICVVLSGTGSDGAQGVRAVKGEGGMAMAQEPGSTEHDGMPRSAIATGLVDYVLPPAEMPAQLIAYAARALGRAPRRAAAPADEGMKKVFVLLRAQTGHDFSQYKESTIARRVERRMAVQQIGELREYVRFLQKTPAEVEALFRDLLIGVTRFFRDPAHFKALQEKVVPGLFSAKPDGAGVRVWVPGCSTGEEAYSIAILLAERQEALKQGGKAQVFATDIDPRAIETARAGLYPAGIRADVAPQRLARFFTKEPGGAYRIHKSVRDMLVFSEQDVAKDPPFSRLDLISCRNLMIYMGAELQKKLIPLFHYALNPGGSLFLGPAETVGDSPDLFSAVDRKARLYQRRLYIKGTRLPALGAVPMPPVAPPRPGKASGAGQPALRELTERALLSQHALVGALVDGRGEVLYLHGRSGRYLEPAPGEAGANILKMAREGLRRELATALRKAAAQKEPVRRAGLRVKTNGDFSTVDLTVRRAAESPASGPALFLVVLEEAPPERKAPAAAGPGGPRETRRVAALKAELRAKEEYLQTFSEELETSNEELKSSNEEMQSVNEELQSSNEELETAKEELQSVNEELSTVNTELQTKVADLTQANNDMNNLMAGTGIGTIFVDHALRIQRFTPAVTQVINLIQTDVGRPVGHIVSNLRGYDRLAEDVQSVLDSLVPREVEVLSKTGAWFQLSIRPYRTLENVIEGAVITFVDITETKRAQSALREAEAARRLAVALRDSRDAVIAQDMKGRILAWNPAAERLYGWTEAEALGMDIGEMIPPALREEALAKVRQLGRAEVLEPCRTRRLAKDGRSIDVWLTATALVDAAGKAYAVATTERPAGEVHDR
jgi:two-component system CheB/CheR fusion protein